ncbi:hypothetical protein GQ53DRAFT_756346 [Thozetella sp. PMI_491]|nr:hypothetical protein GQ53DRAFT_756346 [Thozetella sp. PMI_491]
MTDLVHVVSKRNIAEHAVQPLGRDAPPPPPLPPSSVRVRPRLISLSSNNLSYARGGTMLHWWDAFPVPGTLPAPYNDAQEWGIVPAWGYGVVAESTVDAIKPGSLLWGFWPTASHAVDLQLRPTAPAGSWEETSPHRSQLMTMYNQYSEAAAESRELMAMKALFLWRGSYVLHHGVFSRLALHPLGTGGPWTAEDADLRSAVVVSLSASSKTGRGLAWELARDRDVEASGPLGLLQLTSAPERLGTYKDSKLPTKSAKYHDASVGEWVSSFRPSHIVIMDFGASDAAMDSLLSAISGVAASTTIIAVGSEAKVYTGEELQARAAKAKTLEKVQLNTSALLDRILEVEDPAEFISRMDEAWMRCYQEGGFGDVTVKSLREVRGPQGIEGAWSDLCGGKLAPNVGIVVHLPGTGDVGYDP